MYLKRTGSRLEFRDDYTGGEFGYIDLEKREGFIHKTEERFSGPDTVKTLYNVMRMRIRDIENELKGRYF